MGLVHNQVRCRFLNEKGQAPDGFAPSPAPARWPVNEGLKDLGVDTEAACPGGGNALGNKCKEANLRLEPTYVGSPHVLHDSSHCDEEDARSASPA